jgi:hypothetical protein
MAQYIVYAWYHGTAHYETEFTVEAASAKEAREKAEQLVYKSGGENTEQFEWEMTGIEGDGDYEVDVERDEE